jgi:imidazolonepropionase-like amidohydrolase
MRHGRWRWLLTLLASGGMATAVTALVARAAPPGSSLAIVGARLYPSPDAAPIADGTVVVTQGVISAVGPRESVTVPAGLTVIDGKGLVVTAGFQNSHVHFTGLQWLDSPHQTPAALGTALQVMLTRWGFTTVVDTASERANTLSLRRRIGTGEITGPRILTAGEALYPPDGVPFYVKEVAPAELVRHLPTPTTPAEAAAIVDEHVRDGVDLIKLFTGSWVARGHVLPMPKEIAVAAVAAAHRGHRLVFAHPSNLGGLEVALDAGVDVLAHSVEDTTGMTPAHLQRMRDQHMAMIPTLKLFSGDRGLYAILDEVRDFQRGGGQILFGTDVGFLDDPDPTVEYMLMGAAGLGWREILASLTVNPAARFGESGRRGTLAVGQAGDLVILAADPIRDVRAFAAVRATVRGGQILYSSAKTP